MTTSLYDFEDTLLDLIADETPQKVVLASVHRPTFTQQLTVLHQDVPDFSHSQPAGTVQALAPRSAIRALDRPN